jgi:hypothetical protein
MVTVVVVIPAFCIVYIVLITMAEIVDVALLQPFVIPEKNYCYFQKEVLL